MERAGVAMRPRRVRGTGAFEGRLRLLSNARRKFQRRLGCGGRPSGGCERRWGATPSWRETLAKVVEKSELLIGAKL